SSSRPVSSSPQVSQIGLAPTPADVAAMEARTSLVMASPASVRHAGGPASMPFPAPSPAPAPVAAPISAPIPPPISPPVPAPLPAPVGPPVSAPVPAPVSAPVAAPVSAPAPAAAPAAEASSAFTGLGTEYMAVSPFATSSRLPAPDAPPLAPRIAEAH